MGAARVTASPHDALVKRTFSVPANAAGEIRAVLPEALAARIDWESLALEPGSFVDDEGRERHTDLLFSALLDGRSARIYVLFEHQQVAAEIAGWIAERDAVRFARGRRRNAEAFRRSDPGEARLVPPARRRASFCSNLPSTVDRWMPLRVLVYMTRIWTALREEGQGSLPVILPIVVHHSETGWIAPRRLSELLAGGEALLEQARPYVPDFELLIDDLTRVPEAELAQRAMAAHAKLVVWALRAVRVGFDPALVRIWARALDEVLKVAGVEALELFLRYLSEVEGGPAIYQALLTAGVSEDANEVAMSLRKQWVDEGRAEGREEGRAEGRAEVVLKQLQLKFGPLPEATRERVRNASVEELDRWAERILSAPSLDETLA